MNTNGPDNLDEGTNLNNRDSNTLKINQIIDYRETNSKSNFFDDHKDQTLPDLVHKILLVNDITGQYAVLNIFRKWETVTLPSYMLEIERDHP